MSVDAGVNLYLMDKKTDFPLGLTGSYIERVKCRQLQLTGSYGQDFTVIDFIDLLFCCFFRVKEQLISLTFCKRICCHKGRYFRFNIVLLYTYLIRSCSKEKGQLRSYTTKERHVKEICQMATVINISFFPHLKCISILALDIRGQVQIACYWMILHNDRQSAGSLFLCQSDFCLTRLVHVDHIGGPYFVWLLEPPPVLPRRPFLLFGSAE